MAEVMLECLGRAASQNPAAIRQAEEQLKGWETEVGWTQHPHCFTLVSQPGFYTTLLNVFSDYGIDVNIRWQAVLYFKNGVDRYWRKNSPNGIGEDEKAGLRAGLVKTVGEPVNQIAVQLAVIVSKAARFDVPREWPELLPALSGAVQAASDTVQHRGLLFLHHTLKVSTQQCCLKTWIHIFGPMHSVP